MLKIRAFHKGFDEEVFVKIYNAAFVDYEDIRSTTVEEMKKTEEYPSFSTEGILIAEWDGEAAGMVHAYVDKLREDKKGFIQSLAVLPQFRGRGIAKKLAIAALESLKQRGMEHVDAWAQSNREACVHLFESFGFKKVRATSMMKRTLENMPSDLEGNEELCIREIRLNDDGEISLVTRLENEAFKEHFNFRPRTAEETKYMLQEMPWFKQQTGYLALLDNQPVGYVFSGIDEELNKEKNVKHGWILDIGVLKPHRRRRIGASLMLRSMKRLKDQQMEHAWLYVDDTNPTGAFQLYERLGFEVATKSAVYRLEFGKDRD